MYFGSIFITSVQGGVLCPSKGRVERCGNFLMLLTEIDRYCVHHSVNFYFRLIL